MRELLFMTPHFKQVIWGGCRMREKYGYPIPGEDTGEAWVISGYKDGASVVKGGTWDGWSLDQLWREHGELFGRTAEGQDFPLLVKVIDANEQLSIQVHPDDAYAAVHEHGAKGKSECWYVLDCDADADIIIGHHAKDRAELIRMIDEGKWEELLNYIPLHKGDFFYIPSGTIHAIRKGTLILEIQQSSDTTYRLYDYDRLQNGKPRELHLQKSKEVIACPSCSLSTTGAWTEHRGYRERMLVDGAYFSVSQWRVETALKLEQKWDYLIVDVIEGSGTVDGIPVQAGEHFIIPYGYETVCVEGRVEFITSHT